MATKHVVVKASLLPNVVGRVDYISNPKKQEHIFAFYQTPAVPETFWKELSEVSSERATYNKGRDVIEAREHMVKLPNDLINFDHDELARRLAESFKEKNKVECAVGIHWNKAKSNLHAHIVFPERRVIINPKISIAGRDTYFDADGVRSTKSKCVGGDGKLQPGCNLVKKGEAFPVKKFSGKDDHFRHKEFLREEKQRYADMFSELSIDQWIVYNHKTNPHMRLYNLKRGEPDGLRVWKERENEIIRQYNAVIDEMLENGDITIEQALQIKQKLYNDRAEHRQRIKQERELWKSNYATHQRDFENNRRGNAALYINEYGDRRSSIEVLAIAVLSLVGVDLFREDIDVNDDLVVSVPPAIKARTNYKLQKMVDELCIAAGRKTPAQMLAEKKVRDIAEEVKKPSLEEQIFGAEQKGNKNENKTVGRYYRDNR